MSTLLFWQGKGGKASGGGTVNGTNNNSTTTTGKNWIHAPDALVKGHVAYLVKFLGSTIVDQPKGIEVVKEAIRRLQFAQQLKKSDTGAKTRKVEITISVDGVAIQEPRTNNILHQFPLHRISYCADDKGAKKYFSFIAKGTTSSSVVGQNGTNGHEAESSPSTNGSREEEHECFVFVSTKLASEITFTIGQAFDLAYRRFLNDNGKIMEMQKLQLNNKRLELQTAAYKQRLLALSKVMFKDDVSAFLQSHNLQDITEFKVPADLSQQLASLNMMATNGVIADGRSILNGSKTPDLGIDMSTSSNSSETYNVSTSDTSDLIMVTPSRNSNHFNDFLSELSSGGNSKNPIVGTKLEGCLLGSDSDSVTDFEFDPRASESDPPATTINNITFPPTPAQTQAFSHSPNTRIQQAAPTPALLLAPPPKSTKRQTAQTVNGTQNNYTQNNGINGQLQSAPINITPPQNAQSDPFGFTPFTLQTDSTPQLSTTPNYNISDFNMTTTVFNSNVIAQNQNNSQNAFTNGLAGYDPFSTGSAPKYNTNGAQNGNIFNTSSNGNGFNGFSGGVFGTGPAEPPATLDSHFSGFLDKRISEMKDGFSRGITFGNEDFSVESLDPLRN